MLLFGELSSLTVSQLFPSLHPISRKLNVLPSPASGTPLCQSSKPAGTTLPQVLDKSKEHRSILQAVAMWNAAASTTVLAPGHSHALSWVPRWGLGSWNWKKNQKQSQKVLV